MEKHKYYYNGPVLEFGKCVADHWKGETVASSESKAKSNLAYQYKEMYNRNRGAKVELPGKLILIY